MSSRASGASAAISPLRPGPGAPRPSRRLLALFAGYVRRYLGRHFHAVRLAWGGQIPEPGERALVVYLNHPSWWDPLVALHLAVTLFPGRRHFAPIEAAALARYRFFARLGFFAVDGGSPAGARRFLTVAEAVLAEPGGTLWLTPEGRFTDPRRRPVALASGLAHLARRLAHSGRAALIVPLALEYPFWDERFPEALARFGEPWAPAAGDAERPAAELSALLAERLQAAQDALAAEAQRRDRAAFTTLIGGRAGVGGVYDLWRRLRARLGGERFRAEHGG